ncbi:MAG: tRNA (adenosine(37)-N6)-threonylcarbamoyltransferase complex ATPase subunit type 1 TsaE [Actinomycetota bacterium]|nr:tRNA (adenosine(37)-N6)-threonylcarbamoyltransferase complex ATPase subunit type 1 TsaE [Actinomycetota bacterium]
MLRSLHVTTYSPEETRIVGAALGPVVVPGDVISLNGDLGAGKTVLVQGLVTSLGVSGRVTSPTFTIVQEFDARYPIVHLDVYRLNSFQELLDLGFEELLDPGAILLVEWGEAVAPLLPRRYLQVELRQAADPDAEQEREITFRPRGDEWWRKLEAMRDTAEALLGATAPEHAPAPRFSDAPRPRGS